MFRRRVAVLLPALLLALQVAPAPSAALDNGVGATPPLGWSGFNYWAFQLNETIMLETADALISTGLHKLGFKYVNLDAGWLTSERDPQTHKVIPVKSKWPNGIRAMADKLHAKGLLFGVYTDLSDHTCGWGPGSANHYAVDARTFAHDFQADYLKVDFCGAWNGSTLGRTLSESCGAGALGAGGDLRQANTTVDNATAWCLAHDECGGFTTEGSACDPTNTSNAVRKIYFKDQATRSNGNPAWTQWQKPGIGRVDFHAAPQYKAWKALGDELNKTGRPIYYSICPHTMASHRGTARNYSGSFPATPPIYAPPMSWTAEQRHDLANSLLVEYQNTVDAWYVPGVDKHGRGDWGILTNIDALVEATQLNYSTKGSWNDADMMMVCAFGKGQVPGGGMTLNEYRAHYSVWSILASPLIHGCDLRTVRQEHPECFELISNAEIVKVNQDPAGLPPRLVHQVPPFPDASTAEITEQVFARPLSRNRTAVLLLNRGTTPTAMNVSWQQLGLYAGSPDDGVDATALAVYDVLLQQMTNETHRGGYMAQIPSHDVAFIIVQHG